MASPALSPDHRALLGEDLSQLAGSLPAAVLAVETLSSHPSPERASFRLILGDGTTLKGRRLPSPTQAGRMAQLSACLGEDPIARVLKRHRTALLEQWIDGRSLAAGPCERRLLVAAGSVLGSLATRELEMDPGPRERGGRHRLAKMQRCLDELADRAVISADTAEALLMLARKRCPDALEAGLTHLDFCPENLVVDGLGRLRAIDNETMGFEALDTDLARTWYRWPMGPADREAFLEGYEAHRSAAGFLEHLEFWAVFVLAGAARYRAAGGLPGVPQLQETLETLAAGERPQPWTT